MKRRDFLRGGLGVGGGLGLLLGPVGVTKAGDLRLAQAGATGAGPEAGVDATPVGPRVISTWQHGVAANRAAWLVLARGGRALDAVEQGVRVSESDPNVTSVGLGGWPNADGVVELDACIMDGDQLEAGSVASLQRIRNPISVARRVMEDSPHVLLVGDGARRFAVDNGFREEDLLTSNAREAWQQWKANQLPGAGGGAGQAAPELAPGSVGGAGAPGGAGNHDTIGMIALDAAGSMAAACTTSGLAWKLPGRVGDSPLVGHGLYCDSTVGGAVATGVGEEVIKVCGSYQVVEFMRQGVEPDEAIRRVLQRIAARDAKNRAITVAFVALRADGAYGKGSMIDGFQAAVADAQGQELVPVPAWRSSP